MAGGSWVQHPITGKLIPRDRYIRPTRREFAAVQGNIEAFRSPVDGSIIHTRRQLREHNARHGVVNVEEYGPNGGQEWFKRKHRERSDEMMGRSPKVRAERIDTIRRALYEHGVRD